MIVSRRIAWTILLAAIFTAGLVRQFHARIPSSPWLPGPIGSLLFFLVLILVLVFLRGRGREQAIPYAGEGLRKVNFAALVPILIALMLEKWVSIFLTGPFFFWLDRRIEDPELFDIVYVVQAAAGLFAVTLLVLPLFQRLKPLLTRYLDPARIPVAAVGIVLSLAAVYLGLWIVFRVAGAEAIALRWIPFGRLGALALGAQAFIAFSEELYYRGLLQTELAFLLPSLGVRHDRLRRAGAVALISVSFGLEHLVWSEGGLGDVRRFLFTFACSMLLGTLMMLNDSLWFSSGCHFVLNTIVLGSAPGTFGGGLQFLDATGRPLLDPSLYIFLFFIGAFFFTYARIALRSRRAALAAQRP